MPQLDDMLLPAEASAWMKIPERELMAKSRGGKRAAIPAFRVGPQTIRFCPRAIIAKQMREAGFNDSLIAAAMNLETKS